VDVVRVRLTISVETFGGATPTISLTRAKAAPRSRLAAELADHARQRIRRCL
jgi:hypothetical protein